MFVAGTMASMAQDDMYFVPKKVTKEEKAKIKAERDSLKAVEKAQREQAEMEAFQVQQRLYEDMMVRMYRRIYHEDVDAYNRHQIYDPNDTLVFDSLNTGDDRIAFDNVNDTLYNVDENYKYMRMISRFDDIMLDLDEHSGVPVWFSPWYISPTRLNWAWAYPSPRFYDPFFPGWHGGFYDPLFYMSDPWWYSWYNPWYDSYLGWGGYYGHYGWGFRPYHDVVYYNPKHGYIYGYVNHHGSGGHGGGSHHTSQGNVSVSKYGVRSISNMNSGRVVADYGQSQGSSSGRVSSGSSRDYTPISTNSGRYNGSTTTRTFTPTNNSSSYSSGSYSSGSSRSYSSGGGSYSSGSSSSSMSSGSYGGGGRVGGGSRGAGGRH